MKWLIWWTKIFASSNCLQLWDRTKQTFRLLALVQLLGFLLWHEWVSLYPCASCSRAAELCYSQSLWKQKILPVTWGFFLSYCRSQRSEQLGFAVSSDGGWRNLGNVALNVRVTVSNCKICEFETLTLISYAAYRKLRRKKLWKSGKWKFVMHTPRLNQSWTVLSYFCSLNQVAK